MADQEVRILLEKRLEDNWVLTPIDWDNIRFIPKRGDSFITPIISEDESKRAGFNCMYRYYTFLIKVWVPKNSGTTVAMSYTSALKDLFEGYQDSGLYVIKGLTQRIGLINQWHQENVILS